MTPIVIHDSISLEFDLLEVKMTIRALSRLVDVSNPGSFNLRGHAISNVANLTTLNV